MNFIGSKKSLMPWITECMWKSGIIGKFKTVRDPMCGMGGFEVGLSNYLASNGLNSVHFFVNDMLECCELMTLANVNGVSLDIEGFMFSVMHTHMDDRVRCFVEEYAVKRAYFTPGNAMAIAQWRVAADKNGYAIPIILDVADQLANTASTYGAYLKEYKKSSMRSFTDLVYSVAARYKDIYKSSSSKAYCTGGDCDLIYLDPPYNQRQYGANYHLLDTIAKNDILDFEPKGKSGLRDYDRSMWCYRDTALGELHKELDKFNGRYVVMSYWNCGLISESDIITALGKWSGSDVDMYTMDRNNYKSDADRYNKNERVTEYLFIARRY